MGMVGKTQGRWQYGMSGGGLMSIDMAYMHMIGTRGHEGHIVVRDDILYGVGLTQYINSYAGM